MIDRSRVTSHASLPASQLCPPALACAGIALLVLTACGGGAEMASEAATLPRVLLGETTVVAPLLADDGSAMPSDPRATPPDGAAWTRARRYADERQAAILERALGEAVLSVRVDCCGPAGADLAIATAYAWQASQNLPNGTPVLVRSDDLRLGAYAVERLADAGYANVWLVTQ